MALGTAQELSPVCAYVAERSGSSLSVQQVARLKETLAQRLRGTSEDAYLARLKSTEGAAELAELMAAIAVHKTDLFRDEVQLEAFRSSVLEPLVRAAGDRPLYVWSAGCATGEEVATLLILLTEARAHPASTVLGTDISEPALKQARTLTFHPLLMKRVPAALRERYFQTTAQGFALSPALAKRARFQRHNLMDSPYPESPDWAGFDVIFCRNVLIYFTQAAFDRVVCSLSGRLKMGGTLVLSAAEPIVRPQGGLSTLKCDQAFFYVRSNEQPRRRSDELPAVRKPTGDLPAVAPRPKTGEAPALRLVPAPQAVQPEADPRDEAKKLFELVLEWAAAGEAEAQTEQGLRKCLYLDPHFAQARYLLAMMLEQRSQRADAASEYRRAFAALNEGHVRETAFFLNPERLKQACVTALARLGYR